MKRTQVVGGALAAAVVGIGSLVGYYLHERSAFEVAARPYVKEAVPVLALWNLQVTKAYLAPAEVTGVSDEAWSQAISNLSRLGHLQSAGEPKLTDLSFRVNASLGIYQLATYEIPARFDAGEGSVKIGLLDDDGKFSVLAFHIATTASAGGGSDASHAALSEYHAASR
jgi:hypothetical protein